MPKASQPRSGPPGPDYVEVGVDCASGERYYRHRNDPAGPLLAVSADDWEPDEPSGTNAAH